MSTPIDKSDRTQWCPARPARELGLSPAQASGRYPIACDRCGKMLKIRLNGHGTPLGTAAHRNIKGTP